MKIENKFFTKKISLHASLSFVSVVILTLVLCNLLIPHQNPFIKIKGSNERKSNSSPVGEVDATWRDATLTLLDKTQDWDGPYSGDLATVANGPLDLYTTYYVLMIYKELGMVSPNNEATIEALKSAEGVDGAFYDSFLCRKTTNQLISQSTKMDCIFYGVMALNALGILPDNRDNIVHSIDTLQSAAGPYAVNEEELNKLNARLPDITKDLGATREALKVLEILGARSSNSDKLKSWLLAQWNNDALFTSNVNQHPNISDLAAVGESLERMHVRLGDLPNASARLQWLNNLRTSVLDLRPGKTNMFLVMDWFYLIQCLAGDEKLSTVLNNNFFNQLISLQQPSGSFNVFLGNQADMQGTYQVVHLLKTANREVPRLRDIQMFMERQSLSKGGFRSINLITYAGPTPTLMTLDIRNLLGTEAIDTKSESVVKKFAQKCLLEIISNSRQTRSPMQGRGRLLYDTIALAERAGLDIAPLVPIIEQEANNFIDRMRDSPQLRKEELRDAYYLTQLVSFDASTSQKLEQAILSLHHQSGGFGPAGQDSLEYTWLALGTLEQIQSNALQLRDREQTAAWIRQQQALNGGYLLEDTPNIQASYFAVKSLSILEGEVTPDVKLIHFIKSLQMPYGGIKMTEQSTDVSITSTYYALLIMQQMKSSL